MTTTAKTPTARATMPIILIAQLVTPMSIAGTAIALPSIAADLGAAPTPLQWVVNGFNVAFALGTLLWGSLGDRIGHRSVFRIGAAVFAVGGVAGALAPGLVVLDLARTAAGLGAAAVLVGASSLISVAYEGARRTRAFAVFGTVNGLGLALGPTASGLLMSAIGWRGVFAVHAALLAAAAVAAAVLPRTAAATGARHPVLDLTLLRNREFLAMCLVPVAGSVGFVTLLTYLPSAFSAINGLTPGKAGLLLLAMTVPVLLAPTAAAHLVTRHARVTVGGIVYLSLAALIIGVAGLLLLEPGRPAALAVAPMVMLGIGFGLPVGLVDGHALGVVPTDRAATASGVLNFFRIGSEAVAVAAYSWILTGVVTRRLDGDAARDTAAGRPGHPDVYAYAFHGTIVVLIAALVVVTAAIVVIRARRTTA